MSHDVSSIVSLPSPATLASNIVRLKPIPLRGRMGRNGVRRGGRGRDGIRLRTIQNDKKKTFGKCGRNEIFKLKRVTFYSITLDVQLRA